MEPLFKNKTSLTEENYINLIKFHQRKNNWKYFLFTASFALFLIVYISFQLTRQNYLIVLAMFLCFALFLAYRFLMPYYRTQKEIKSDKISKNLVNYYSFYDKYFIVKNKFGVSKLKYRVLYRVYETETCFYLYLDKSKTLILEKVNFVTGDSNSFEKFIKNKVRFKFKKEIN